MLGFKNIKLPALVAYDKIYRHIYGNWNKVQLEKSNSKKG